MRRRLKLTENTAWSRYQWAAEQLRASLPTAPGRIVADIGAGEGRMRAVVENAGAEWFGYDLLPRVEGVSSWDLEQVADSRFPKAAVVMALDVLEHLRNPWRCMMNISDHLLPGGYLILTTPNPGWSRSRMWALANGVPSCFTQLDLDSNHHVFTPWPHIVERLLADRRLEAIRYDTLDGRTRWPGRPLGIRYPLRLALALVTKCIERRDPRSRGMSYGVVARKAVA